MLLGGELREGMDFGFIQCAVISTPPELKFVLFSQQKWAVVSEMLVYTVS